MEGLGAFDGHKRVKGRKRYIPVDKLGIPIACRVEPANMSDRCGAEHLLGGLGPLFPGIRTIMADAGYEGRKLARQLMRQDGWKLVIVKHGQRIQDHWLDLDCGENVRLTRPQSPVQQRLRIRRPTAQTMIDIASLRMMLNRLEPV